MFETPKAVKVYSLLDPSTKIWVCSGDLREEAALISYVYTLTGPRRPKPSVEPEFTIYKNLRPWKKLNIPSFVVVKEGDSLIGAPIIVWNGKKSLQGDVPWGHQIVGKIASQTSATEYEFVLDTEALDLAKKQAAEKAQVLADRKKSPIVETPPPPKIEPPTIVDGYPADYTGDPFTRTTDGHYVGNDGFIVPRNFDEFYERFPKYVMAWVKKRLNRYAVDDDVEDWTQDLLIHMKFLPLVSKHRLPGANGREQGCGDVIETFNPIQQYGASEQRFRYYINFCLANKFNTIQTKRLKNPVCRYGNVQFGAAAATDTEWDYLGKDDEFIHSHSTVLAASAEKNRKQHNDRLFTNQFKRYVRKTDPIVYPAIEALEATGPLSDAAAYIGVSEQEFSRLRTRLKRLAECFTSKSTVPKQRRPYKKRTTPMEETS